MYIILENDKGNLQAKSREAVAMTDYLMLIIRGYDTILKEFSLKDLVEPMKAFGHSEKTVKRITTTLENNEIIIPRKVAHGKKIFQINDLKQANSLWDEYSHLKVLNRKYEPETRITPTKMIKDPPAKLSSNFPLELQIDGKTTKRWHYPKTEYLKKICPICSGKLIKTKSYTDSITKNKQTHDLDKKCRNCKSIFLYERPSEKSATDEKIIIKASNTNIEPYFTDRRIDEDRMKRIREETEKIIENANKWKNSFK